MTHIQMSILLTPSEVLARLLVPHVKEFDESLIQIARHFCDRLVHCPLIILPLIL